MMMRRYNRVCCFQIFDKLIQKKIESLLFVCNHVFIEDKIKNPPFSKQK